LKTVEILYFIVDDYETICDQSISKIKEILTTSEIEKFNRYRLLKDQINFLLGRYLARKKNNLPNDDFLYNEFNKPFCLNCGDFNISHTDNMVAAAFSEQFDVGIDVEVLKPIQVDDLVNFFASPEEKKQILDKSGYSQLTEFYRIWTTKEAILKADGTGLIDRLPELSIDEIINRNKSSYYGKIINKNWYLSCFVKAETNEKIKFDIKKLDYSFFNLSGCA